jgi:ABC-type transport system involved in multi-copper enzyme maturation permease subunit
MISRTLGLLASLPGALAGPILTKELRVSSRRRRNYVLRSAYLAVLTVFIVLVWLATVRWESNRDYAYRVSRMAIAGRTIIVWIAWFQFIVIQIVTVVMLSTSISEEVYAKTLGVLMTTPINSFQIVVGKLFSKILQLLLLLAASLPMLAVLRVLGGVPWDFVVASLCITLTTALLVASVTMFFSILFRWAFVSILMSMGALAVIYGLLPLIFSLLVAAMELRDKEVLMPMATVLINYNPVAIMVVLTVEMFEPRAFTRGGPGGAMFFFAWWVNCLVSLGLASLILAACVAMVRKVGLRMVAGATGAGPSSAAAIAASAGPALAPVLEALNTPATASPTAPAFATAAMMLPPVRLARVREIKGSPIIWRELRSTWLKRGVLFWVLTGVGFWLLLLIYALVAWAEHRAFYDNDVHVVFIVVYTIIAALATCVLAATNITSEKESRSWELLLCTPLGDWHILLAKFVGALRRCVPIWLLPIAHILLFTLAGCCHLALLPMYLLIAGGMVVLLVGGGLYCGSRFRRTTTAVMLNIALGLGLWAALPGGMALLAEAGPPEAYRSGLRDATEFVIDTNPVFQAGMVTERLGGDRLSFFEPSTRDWSSITFSWAGMGQADFAQSLTYLALLTSLNIAFATFLAWRAKCQFRKRWF